MSNVIPFKAMLAAAEAGFVPDSLMRFGIRRLLTKRLRELARGCDIDQEARLRRLIADASSGPIGLVPEQANRQHYEVPSEFFRLVLGRRLKYSCCFWPDGVATLDEAEEAALRVTCKRAGIEDGMRILELGCGWGSLSLWMAQNYPQSAVTAVSNSATQREFIDTRAAESGIHNLHVVTADMNHFSPGEQFDRIVSVEMFEHMRNHRELLRRVSGWLLPEGRLFVHVFCHRQFAYPFESNGPQDWMAEHFFTGGMMPSDSLLAHYDQHLRLTDQWRWNGTHYARTAGAWLDRMDAQIDRIRPILQRCYGPLDADTWIGRWRLFLMACAELFAFRGGDEWYVSHYLFERQPLVWRTYPELGLVVTSSPAAPGPFADSLE